MKGQMIVSTLAGAANEGYRQGFEEGYAAARLTIEVVVKAWRKEPWAYDLEGALTALDLSREKAVELMGTPVFVVSPVPVVVPDSNIVN